jgi:hypothetical protein
LKYSPNFVVLHLVLEAFMKHPAGDPLRIDPDHQRPSILGIMAGGIPKRNDAFHQYALDYNKCVDRDEKQFHEAISSSFVRSKGALPGRGYYDDPAKAPSSPIKLGTEIQADARAVKPSKVTDINTISVHGQVVGFVYRTESGHMALQEAIPDSTVSKAKGYTWGANLGFSHTATGGVTFAQTKTTTTSLPNRGDVVPLTRLEQLPKSSIIQPLDGTHSRRVLPDVPHGTAEQFQKDRERPDAFTYRFSRMLPHVSGRLLSIDKILHVRRGEEVTIVNGREGLETHQQQQQHHDLGRV